MSELRKETAAELEEEEFEENDEPDFIVNTDEKAEWCLNIIRQRRQEKEKWKAHYDKLYNQVADHCDASIRKMERLLQDYFQMQQDAGFTRKTKSQVIYSLPTGKIFMKRQDPKYEINQEELVPWLEKNDPELVKVQKKADWETLKDKLTLFEGNMVTTDAEVVPGITVTERPDVFKVEAK